MGHGFRLEVAQHTALHHLLGSVFTAFGIAVMLLKLQRVLLQIELRVIGKHIARDDFLFCIY